MKNVLIVSGHDTVVDSVANKLILKELAIKLPEATFDNLDDQYANFEFNIEKEQERLVNADIIVLEFPFSWYSMPALMHHWMEQTFQHGFSHGSTGDKLKGKTLIISFTTGAPDFAYDYEGMMKFPLEHYMAPFISTCILTNMNYGGFIATTGVSYADRTAENEDATKEKLSNHVDRLIALINSIK